MGNVFRKKIFFLCKKTLLLLRKTFSISLMEKFFHKRLTEIVFRNEGIFLKICTTTCFSVAPPPLLCHCIARLPSPFVAITVGNSIPIGSSSTVITPIFRTFTKPHNLIFSFQCFGQGIYGIKKN